MLESSSCVVTVTTEDFVPGAMVALHSFQRRNSWFKGDFVVIHDGLSETAKAAFDAILNRVRFEQLSEELRDWIQRMIELRPEVAAQRSQFFALDVFRLTAYEKVLFCDSDLLFRADISELWNRQESLICCRDRPAYLGNGRDRETFAMCAPQDDSLTNTFNSGFLLIDKALLNDTEYQRLLGVLSHEQWSSITAAHTDQLILNHAFAGRQCLIDGTYNYLLKHAAVMKNHAGIAISDAKVLHYNLAAKPWQHDRLIPFRPADPAVFSALTLWNEAFVECLQTRYLRKEVTGLIVN